MGKPRNARTPAPTDPFAWLATRIDFERTPPRAAPAAFGLARMRRLLAEDPGLVALHAGDGPMRDALARAMADVPADRFRMLGVRADVGSLMTLATVVLHTSRKEGTPNALLEAQSLGCPVVATAGGGTVDAVEDGGSGALCAVDDVEALQARAGEILRDPALRARMSARAAAFVRERFGMERMVRETLDVCGIPHASLGGAP